MTWKTKEILTTEGLILEKVLGALSNNVDTNDKEDDVGDCNYLGQTQWVLTTDMTVAVVLFPAVGFEPLGSLPTGALLCQQA